MLYLSKLNVKDKSVLVRIDINTSIIKNKPQKNDRFVEHAKTIRYLLENKAKVTILTHQGRRGRPDFVTNLKKHAKILSKEAKKKIKYVDDLYGEKAIKEIKKLKPGKAIMLENVRDDDHETRELSAKEHTKSKIVQKLSPLFDLFVFDAFSVAHRSHASVVGFMKTIRSCAGLILEKELNSICNLKKRLKQARKGHVIYILAGAKPEEDLLLLKEALKHKATILLGGTFVLFYLSAKGKRLGKSDEILERKPEILKELEPIDIENTFLPMDFAITGGKDDKERHEIGMRELPSEKLLLDLGKHTVGTYREVIKKADVIIIKGPLGKYEDPRFEFATREIYNAIAHSNAFTVIGGGNTVDAINRFGIPTERFSFISLGGGALLHYLAGQKLPGLVELEKAK
jgi:phosphoglycerate kinase